MPKIKGQRSILPQDVVLLHGRRKKPKQGIIMGLGNTRSLAWEPAMILAWSGVKVFPICHTERRARRFNVLKRHPNIMDADFCDVTKPDEMDACFARLATHGEMNFVLHCTAGGVTKEMMSRSLLDVTNEEMIKAMVISAFSLKEMVRCVLPLMPNGGGIGTLSYIGAERATADYDLMGVMKAALERLALALLEVLGEKFWVTIFRLPPKRTVAAEGVPGGEQLGFFERAMSPRGLRAARWQMAQAIAYHLLADTGFTGVLSLDNGARLMLKYPRRNARTVKAVAEQDIALLQDDTVAPNSVEDIQRDE